MLDFDVLGDPVRGKECGVALGAREADFAVNSVHVLP